MQVHELTLYDVLVRNAFIYGDRPAVIHPQGSLTFRDFVKRVLFFVSSNNYARAIEVCNAKPDHPLSRVLKAGLLKPKFASAPPSPKEKTSDEAS